MLRGLIFLAWLGLTGSAIYFGGVYGAQSYERLLRDRVRHGLEINDIDWVRLRSDGLRIEVHGRAPSLEQQALALETARAVSPTAKIVDYSSAVLMAPPKREPIQVELHRGPDGLTIMGRFHGSEMKRSFVDTLRRYLPSTEVHDFSGETAARPRQGWGPELELAAIAISSLKNAIVKIEPGRLTVDGAVPDQAARSAFSQEILVFAGSEIALDLTIRVPPVAIVPFEFSVTKTFGGLRVDSCAARSVEERDKIAQLLTRYGVVDYSGICVPGLGGPRGDWAGAVEAGLRSLDQLPAGRLRLSYHQLTLEAAQPSEEEDLDAALALLNDSLPGPFTVRTRSWDSGRTVAVPRTGYWMDIEMAEGTASFTGRMPGEEERDALLLFARALLPDVDLATSFTITEHVPPLDWLLSVQTAIEGLAGLDQGSAQVSAGRLSLQGVASDPETVGLLHRDLEAILPDHQIQTAVTIDLPDLVAEIPFSEPACLSLLNSLVGERPIVFEAGEAEIAETSRPVLSRITALLERCEVDQVQVTGFTDSQGREEMNQRLSQNRANAVVDALIALGIPYMRLAAVGMGEAEPIASNETAEGRALNRRIEFHAIE